MKEKIFNSARQKAFESFDMTLNSLYGRKNISEKMFKDEWQKNLKQETSLIADGWYNPPPKGMAVLFGNRVSFDTLRDEKNWSNDTIINWKEDLLYVYCSPIDKSSGIIGDMSLTLYFGQDEKIKNHIKNCYNAVQEVFSELGKLENSAELFSCSEQIFAKHQLKNCVISKTDYTPLDLGHTFPKLENLQAKESLTEIEKQEISKARKFINADSNWKFEEGMQFTIEPQLVSIEDSSLPQISQHYLIKKEESKFTISDDVQKTLEKYKLINSCI